MRDSIDGCSSLLNYLTIPLQVYSSFRFLVDVDQAQVAATHSSSFSWLNFISLRKPQGRNVVSCNSTGRASAQSSMLDSKTSKATFCQHDKDGCCDVISSTTSASRGLQVRQWVDSICSSWDFKQIIPAHFDAPIPAGPADLRSCPPCLACFQTYCLLPNRAEAPGSLISNCKLFGSERDSLLAEQLCCPLFRSSEY